VYAIDPLQDPRWPAFVEQHSAASIFHTPGWLRALQRTYHHDSIAFTTSPPAAALADALLFTNVDSWLTGRRLISLAFSDHCEPLITDSRQLLDLCRFAERIRTSEGGRYVEIRPETSISLSTGGFHMAQTFYLHRLDLRPSLDALHRSFHKDCVQRKIRRAEREQLTYETGRSESLLRKLYALLQLTRRRHQLPVQPLKWFRNLVDCLGDKVCIRIVSREGRPVAGILTLTHRNRILYKYGGSDARLHNLGGMALLLWRTIQEAKQMGLEEIDLGRTDRDNLGLIAFKEHWAARRSLLTTWRCPAAARAPLTEGPTAPIAKKIFARLPDGLLNAAGRLLYQHIA